HEQTDGDVRYVTLDLNRPDHADSYTAFANRTLWPLLHSRLDLVDYARETRAGYRRVNLLFAEKLAPLLRDDDLLWIHDYHLIPLAAMLRERGVGCRIGFFLHVPMPSADLVSSLPEHGRLLSTLYAYDLIGYQIMRDSDRFRTSARIFGGGSIEPDGSVTLPGGKWVAVGNFPIGIDAGRIAAQSAAAVGKPAVRALRESMS